MVVALMALAAFLLLTAYYLLKTVREPLILLQGGAEVKLYARASQTVIMLGVVHVYGELARRFGRRQLLTLVFLFFSSNLLVFWILAGTQLQIGLAFFLWVGVFSYTVVAQFWALAADIYTDEQGTRLFPIIGGGSSVGAVAGAWLARSLVRLGTQVLMGAAIVILLACVALISWVQRRAAAPRRAERSSAAHEAPLSQRGAIELLIHDRYLLLIAGMVVLLNWVNSSGEYLLDRVLLGVAAQASAAGGSAQALIGGFKADYFAWYNLLGMGLQLLVVSRILRVVGVRKALSILPAFALVAYGAAARLPILAVVRLVKIGENALQYSLQDTTRHALFLVASRAEKFVGKTAVDTVAVRIGAIMSTLMVIVGTRLGWSTTTFAAINVGLAMIWLGFVVAIGREHRLRSVEQGAPCRGAGVAA
ncbi:MAG TPA: Npt1/Npt2 family nucleotide transporter [Vicinamibacteria bacterium]|nr:Npt1/Npt2 family nucleotide transporter [Vicinamibacteria bacterium]